MTFGVVPPPGSSTVADNLSHGDIGSPTRAGGTGFDARWRASVGGRELERVRNFKPAFKRGLWIGLLNSSWELLTAGHSPWTLKNSADWSRLRRLDEFDSPERGWV